MTATNYFVSDLHLLTSRTLAGRHEQAMHAAAANAKRFILGGDIFDFGWSTERSPERAVDWAMGWLKDFVDSYPACEFHFIFGNHDYNQRFIHAVETYSATDNNFRSHRYYVRLGQSLFLHGDIVDKKQMCHDKLDHRRSKYLHDGLQSPWRHTLYEWATHARVHRVVSRLANPRKRTALRLLTYLHRIGHGPDTGTQHVYFGHTHEPLTDYALGGITFHNPGAPFAGVEFRIVEAQIEEAKQSDSPGG